MAFGSLIPLLLYDPNVDADDDDTGTGNGNSALAIRLGRSCVSVGELLFEHS